MDYLGDLMDSLRVDRNEDQRDKPPDALSVLFIDLDDFKQVNDTFGHPVGDEVLRLFGGLIIDHTRRHEDVPARYGGEEFVIALPDATEEMGVEKANKIIEALSELVVEGAEGRKLSCSIGVASILKGEQFNKDELLEHAAEPSIKLKLMVKPKL